MKLFFKIKHKFNKIKIIIIIFINNENNNNFKKINLINLNKFID